jgi:hypothetical protein
MKLPLKAQISFDPEEVARDLIEAYVLETAMADPELAASHVLENLGRGEVVAFAQGFFNTMKFNFDYAEAKDVIPLDRRLAIAVIGRLIRNRFKPLVDEGVSRAAVTQITTRDFEGSEDRKIKAAIALLTSYGYSVT